MQSSLSSYASDTPSQWGIILLFLFLSGALALICRLIAGSFDGDRVEEYIKSIGGRLLEKHWEPFGPGWFGTHGARIYHIVYEDTAGRIHHAHLKTSMFSGVYLTKDTIVGDADSHASTEKGQPYGTLSDSRLRQERGVQIADDTNLSDGAAQLRSSKPRAKHPVYNELLEENEQLKARIRELEGHAVDEGSGDLR